MRSIRLIILLSLLGIMSFTTPLLADGKAEIQASMTKMIGEVTTLIRDKSLTKEKRNKAIDTLVSPLFDFGLMGRLTLGKEQWKKITPKERKAFSGLFEKRVKQSYMNKLDLYTDEVIVVDDAVTVKNRIHLPTYLVRNNEKRDIVYKFYKSKKRGWLIYDVDILGVSIIQTYRTQFSGILKEETFAVLLEKLKTLDS